MHIILYLQGCMYRKDQSPVCKRKEMRKYCDITAYRLESLLRVLLQVRIFSQGTTTGQNPYSGFNYRFEFFLRVLLQVRILTQGNTAGQNPYSGFNYRLEYLLRVLLQVRILTQGTTTGQNPYIVYSYILQSCYRFNFVKMT